MDIGRITKATVGLSDNTLGLALTLRAKGWAVTTSYCYEPDCNGKESDPMHFINALKKLLREAEVESIEELVGKLVECEFTGSVLESIKILHPPKELTMSDMLEQYQQGTTTEKDLLDYIKRYIKNKYPLNDLQVKRLLDCMSNIYGKEYSYYVDYIEDYCDTFIEISKVM